MMKFARPIKVFIIMISGILAAEVMAMIAVLLNPGRPLYWQVALDAGVMVVIIFPLLYFLSYRPLLHEIRYRQRSEWILGARFKIMTAIASRPVEETDQVLLDEINMLLGSRFSYLLFVEADQNTITRQLWSGLSISHAASQKQWNGHDRLDQVEVWASVVKTGQPAIIASPVALPMIERLTEPHTPIQNLLLAPLMRQNKVVALLGCGNKPGGFDQGDEDAVAALLDFSWDIIQHRQADARLVQSEEKFRTLVEWTYDWEKWLGPDGKIIYTSPASQRISGYSPEQIIADPDLLVKIIHPEDRQAFIEHRKLIHDAQAGPFLFEYRIRSADGAEHWIEHICRPLYTPDGRYLGRRISDRDITERKLSERKILEQSRQELMLTRTIRNIENDLAHDLHDTLGQNISYLRMTLAHLAETEWKNLAAVKTQVHSMSKAADESYDLIRTMLTVLRLDGQTDPLYLFSRYAKDISQRSALEVNLVTNGDARPLSAHQIRQLFYIFREALSNIEKHARATQATVEVTWQADFLQLELFDNGIGFDIQSGHKTGHYGLEFMRDRAAKLQGNFAIHTSPGNGARIVVTAPYEVIEPDEDMIVI